MAVMKVCCGCMSTRSGTLAVLLLYLLIYIAGIIVTSIGIGNETVGTFYVENIMTKINCTKSEAWWCQSLFDVQYEIRSYVIVLLIMLCLFVVFDLIALFGTGRGSYWPLLPWIILEFIRLFAKVLLIIMVIIIWAMYLGESKDYSYIIATGVIGAGVTAFFYYLWLCVVSYFQLLREIDQIGNIHKVQDSPSHKVTPFVVSDYDNENPYDNMSQNTTKESLDDDVTSIKSGVKSPIPENVKTTNLENNE